MFFLAASIWTFSASTAAWCAFLSASVTPWASRASSSVFFCFSSPDSASMAAWIFAYPSLRSGETAASRDGLCPASLLIAVKLGAHTSAGKIDQAAWS
jgi:hypothetical protein